MIKSMQVAYRRACLALVLLVCALPVSAQTRAWLDREQVTFGETATLNIESDNPVQQIDTSPLAANFDIAGQTVSRSFQIVNGHASAHSLLALGIRPRAPGVFTVPALRVGNDSTQPLQLTVMPASVRPASSNADAFLETELDTEQPYVQQTVGMVVRLYVGVNLAAGQLQQDQPPDASLQQVGDDLRYQRQIDGRTYTVIERHYQLVPERSGGMEIPGARFTGEAASDFFDSVLGNGGTSLSAAAPAKHLQVRPIPANAPQPWLPLRDLQLRYVQMPRQARAGAATTVEVEMTADGASASQLPALSFAPSTDAQVFADPPQTDEKLVDGRPRATVRLRFSIVPLHAGELSLQGPRVEWWDAAQGVARTALLPPLQLQVAPGAASSDLSGRPGDAAVSPLPAASDATAAANATTATAAANAPALSARLVAASRQPWPWLVLLGLGVLLGGWWLMTHRQAANHAAAADPAPANSTHPKLPPKLQPLAQALEAGELADIADALCSAAGLPGDGLDTLRMQLDDASQAEAVAQLQAARWGNGNPASALASLRAAFGKGLHLRQHSRPVAALLPPLYPQS